MNRPDKADRDPDSGHAPTETDDQAFAPVTRGADHRGRTTRAHEGDDREPTTGTGVAGRETRHPDALPAHEQGVEQAERYVASRDHEPGR